MSGYRGREAVWKAITRYCAYQERCHEEVRQKLRQLAVGLRETDETLAKLIEENYLNESRFAALFAGGRFRMKHWGKLRIAAALKQKKIGERAIKEALAAFDPAEYLNAARLLALKKLKDLSGSSYERRAKLRTWLVYKGYERPVIDEVLAEDPFS